MRIASILFVKRIFPRPTGTISSGFLISDSSDEAKSYESGKNRRRDEEGTRDVFDDEREELVQSASTIDHCNAAAEKLGCIRRKHR